MFAAFDELAGVRELSSKRMTETGAVAKTANAGRENSGQQPKEREKGTG